MTRGNVKNKREGEGVGIRASEGTDGWDGVMLRAIKREGIEGLRVGGVGVRVMEGGIEDIKRTIRSTKGDTPMLTLSAVRNGEVKSLTSGLCDAVKRAYIDSGTPSFIVCPYAKDMTDADMLRFYRETGKLRVWAGGSDRTIYGCEYINWMARAWHDWCHITSGVCNVSHRQHGPLGCFEPTAEYDVADYQCRGLSDTLARIVQIEVSEQARYYQQTGQFVDDQVTFTLHHLRHCKGATHGTA